ncbi:F-box/WD repeat-containing protein 5 [Ischnura elegans]|uniref:F-box/WD repeat-containing protein 5 n=1 Tax=Ischnura elegans TaxID=197161 RepID=UPI001ED88DD5|nr:F-box/WD repeat-containing protein 5 [Ischnura elegans]
MESGVSDDNEEYSNGGSGSCSSDESSVAHLESYGKWAYLPEEILRFVFQYLSAEELLTAGRTCQTWLRVSYDEILWKNLFLLEFDIDPSIGLMHGKTSWYSEYKRLKYHTPIVETEVLKEHSHQVLHVSFAHNGKMFATCSKDGYIMVWDSGYPARVKYHRDMKTFCWKYTQYSQFNPSDTLLLVSGVHFGSPHSTSGEIAVFSLEDEFCLQCRVVNKPYDIFGTWYSDEHLLSGNLHWLAHLVSASVLWLNKASQESASEHVPIMGTLFRFYNRNASSVRAITVANCLAPSPLESSTSASPDSSTKKQDNDPSRINEARGNPPSHRSELAGSSASQSNSAVRQVTGGVYSIGGRFETLEGAFSNWKRLGDGSEYASPIQYSADYHRAEQTKGPSASDVNCDNEDPDGEGDDASDVPSGSAAGSCQESPQSSLSSISMEMEDSDSAEAPLDPRHKFLIFTTGSKTYTPHQIGFKRIHPFSFPRRLDPGPSLKERIALKQRERELAEERELARAEMGIEGVEGGVEPQQEPNWLDFDSVAHRFDSVDHLIDLHGHIIGMGLSPDHRYLYVNSRPWPVGYHITNPLDPPPIAQEIDIHVIDLTTLREVGTMLRSHKAYTPNNECFFIFLDVCNEYVASGAEDKHGYLWDRYYGACLARLPHGDVVNAVAFDPRDSEVLLTASDDHTVKVWRSKAQAKKLGLLQNNGEDGERPHIASAPPLSSWRQRRRRSSARGDSHFSSNMAP